MTTDLDYPYAYEASDEASETELLDKSLSVWKGWTSLEAGEEDFKPIPLDLHTSASIGQYDCVRTIIDRGEEDLNKKNRGGWTPLMYAAYIGHDNIVNLLLEASVSVNIRNPKGQTALHLAASCGNESVAYFLLQADAEIEARDNKGWTSLFHATYSGHQNMVKFLLDNNANMEAMEPSRGITPFMEAAGEGHEIIVHMFLQNGVNISAKAHNGDTAQSLALLHGHMKIVSMIDNYTMPLTGLRADPGHHVDLSSSDEAFHRPRHVKGSRHKPKGPSIQDGPAAFAKMMNKVKTSHAPPHTETAKPYPPCSNSCVPSGYVSFHNDGFELENGEEICSRDMTSPINADDHRLDSSGGVGSKDSLPPGHDPDEEDDAFSKTGALTIKSSSSSSGGLMAALGINRDDSVDSNDEGSHDAPQQQAEESESKKLVLRNHGAHRSPVRGAGRHRVSKIREHLRKDNRTQNHHMTKSVLADDTKDLSPRGRKTETRLNHDSHDQNMTAGEPDSSTPLRAPPINDNQDDSSLSSDENSPSLEALLDQLGLSKYITLFQEQDVDLQVFLSLTDNDLKEIGVKLFGPRRKMTNAIARWHSRARPAAVSLEQAYADKLEAEMQELAIQLHQAYDQVEKLKAQVLQEKELRSVTEGCLMEDRKAWQHVRHVGMDTQQHCGNMGNLVKRLCLLEMELKHRQLPGGNDFSKPVENLYTNNAGGLASATQEGWQSDKESRNEIHKISNEQLFKQIDYLLEELNRSLALTSINCDKLLGRELSFQSDFIGLA